MTQPLLILTLTRCGQWQVASPTDRCWFALQCSVAFDGPLPDGTDVEAALRKVMPWTLLGAQGAADTRGPVAPVPLRAFVVQADGTSAQVGTAARAELPTSSGSEFARSIRSAAESHLLNLAIERPTSIVWKFDNQAGPDGDEGGSLGEFLQYLCSLPGEVARQAGTVLYFSIAAADLFEFPDGSASVSKEAKLWVAPEQLYLDGALALSSAPAKVQSALYLESTYAAEGQTRVTTRGPGAVLADLLVPMDDHPVFSLRSYGVGVREASSDLLRLESIVLDAVDGATRSRALTDTLIQDVFRLVRERTPVALPEDARKAIRAADQVLAFAARCRESVFREACSLVGECLALQLASDAEAASFRQQLAAVVRQPVIDKSSPSNLVLSLGKILGVKAAPAKDMLEPLAAQCSEASLSALLVAELGRALDDGTGLPLTLLGRVREAWKGMADGDNMSRRLALAQIGWRDWREQHEAQPLLNSLQDLGGSSLTPKKALRARVRDAVAGVWTAGYLQQVTGILQLGWIDPAEGVALAGDPNESALRIADAVLSIAWSEEETRRTAPATSNGGFLFALGEEMNELVHLHPQGVQEAEWSDGFAAVSGFGIMVRRASPGQDMAARPWRLVTGGLARLASGATLDTPLAIPQRVVFDRNLWRAETEYAGTHLLTQSSLADAYGETGHSHGDGSADNCLIAYAPPSTIAQLSPPPLRYGDSYQVAAFVIDQGAGLPKAIAKPDAPWSLDPAALDDPLLDIDAAKYTKEPYRRCASVGDLSIAPAGPDGRWPLLPPGVHLRAKEWWQAASKDGTQAPVVLLREDGDALIQNEVPQRTAFNVFPPSVDEHVLLRWAAPPVDAMTNALFDDLVRAYTDLLLARAREGTVKSPAQDLLPHDPAVRKIGVRATFVDASNAIRRSTPVSVDLKPISPDRPFTTRPVSVQVSGHKEWMFDVDKATGTVTVQLPAGEFMCLELFPMVSAVDMSERFDMDVVAPQLAMDVSIPGWVAFKPAVFLAETASAKLPRSADLYENFRVSYVGDAVSAKPVECRFRQTVADLVMVQSFLIEREKWVWRNLPMSTTSDLNDLAGGALLRRLSGGLPDASFANPDGNVDVTAWETIANVDNGLSVRTPVNAVWPSQAPDDKRAGGPAGATVLHMDALEGSPQGMYLRYRLTVNSRYAPVIVGNSKRMQEGPNGETWRRCVAPARVQRVRPLKVLGLIPLTESVGSPPPGFGEGARPFVVLLDEIWFREYGVNERLEVVLALENPDILADDGSGQSSEERDLRPFRVGRLPDHHLPKPVDQDDDPYGAKRYFLGTLTNEAGAAATPKQLQAFGPFGFTMDTTPDEALANATAFVVTPPAEWMIGPHWAMFVKLRRVLDYPNVAPEDQVRSEWSDAKSVYTLPDARKLCSGEGRVVYEHSAQILRLEDMTWILDPVSETDGQASPARSDYRYFIMVSRLVTDAGSETQREVPIGLIRVAPPAAEAALTQGISAGAVWIGTTEPPKGSLRGRLLEIWAEARLDDGEASRLDEVQNPVEFWNGLLRPIEGFGEPGKDDSTEDEEDAAGMIRRVSPSFEVRSM